MSVIVVSAPSGAGKSTLHKLLLAECDDVNMSVSHTTRQPRQGEENGVAYHFINKDEFKKMTDNREFIEWAEVHVISTVQASVNLKESTVLAEPLTRDRRPGMAFCKKKTT